MDGQEESKTRNDRFWHIVTDFVDPKKTYKVRAPRYKLVYNPQLYSYSFPINHRIHQVMCVDWAMKNGGLTLWSVLGGIPAPLGPRRLTGQRSGRASTRIACGGGGQGGPSGPTVESSNSPMVPKWLKYPPHHGWYMGMDQYLLIPFLGGWTSINPSYFDVNRRGTIGFDTLPYVDIGGCSIFWGQGMIRYEADVFWFI